jgi:hypothetical protein
MPPAQECVLIRTRCVRNHTPMVHYTLVTELGEALYQTEAWAHQ